LLQITYSKLIGIDGQACYYAVLLRFNKEMLMNLIKRGIFQGSKGMFCSESLFVVSCSELQVTVFYFNVCK